jgi:hypothetical protein
MAGEVAKRLGREAITLPRGSDDNFRFSGEGLAGHQLGHPLTGTAAAVRLEALARFCNAGRPAGISARRRKRNRLSGRGAYGLGMGDTRNTNDIA